MTAGPTKTVDFFVVGAPKTGTTSLYHYLRAHPQIFLPVKKELHRFSYPEVCDTYYRVECIDNDEDYRALYEARREETAAGDISPSYLSHPEAARRIHRFNPEARIIMILRDPVDRCVSHYLMDLRRGFQNRGLSAFLERNEENRLYFREYVELGFYHDQVQRFLDAFGRDRVLVLLYDDLQRDPAAFLRTIHRFLGVDDGFLPDLKRRYNAFRMPRTTLHYHVRRFPWLAGIAERMPERLKSAVRAVLFRGTSSRPDFEPECRRLAELYRADVDRLSRLLGRDLSHWLA